MSDATIIGAGPAGCAAAVLLARAGWNVTLIEQHRFPRDKVCGECLSALGIEVLDRIGLKSTIAALAPVELTRAELVSPDRHVAAFDLPHPMWGISRAALDRALLDAARAAGARIFQPARCESAGTEVVVRDLTTNQISRLRPSYILIADGKAACGLAHPRPTSDLGVKAHFTNIDCARDTISLLGLHGHYIGLAPIESDRWNVAMSIPAARVKAFAGDFDGIWNNCLRENPELAHRVGNANRISPWLASPLPRFTVRHAWPPRIIPLGNAAAAIEPIGGEGMGLALRSAELAATALVSSRQEKIAALPRAFARLWRTRSLTCRAGAIALSHPRIATFVVRAAPSFSSLALSLLGK